MRKVKMEFVPMPTSGPTGNAPASDCNTEQTPVTREWVRQTIASPIWNASNHPTPSAVLGRDVSKLIEAVTDAVLAKYVVLPKGEK